MKKILLSAFMLLSITASFAQVRVLYFCDGIGSSGTDHMLPALTAIGADVTAVTTHPAFESAIATPGDFDIAIYFMQSNWPLASSVAAMANFMSIPGKKGMYCDWSRDAGFGANFGIGFTGTINETNVTITDPSLAAGLTTNPFTLTNPGWGTFSTGLTPLTGGVVAGTFGSGQAALVKTMGGNMYVFGYTNDAVALSELYVNVLNELSVTSITTTPFSGPLCAGADINIPYTTTGVFGGTNTFTAQLSDASGSFASPTTIGSVSGTSGGTINATLPFGLSGVGYRIRVSGNDPVIDGADNGSDLVIEGPTATYTATPIVCYGDNSSVTISATGGTAPYTGTGTFSVPAGSYTYTITDALGCESAEVTGVITQPAAITHSQSIAICHYESVTIGPNTYNAAGTYVDILSNADGCDSTLTTVLTVKPVNTMTATTDDVIVSLAPSGGATYQWLNCGTGMSVIAGQTGQFYTASANGNYAVVVTEDGCKDTSLCTAITTVGIGAINSSEGLSIYPNPANGMFTLEAATTGSGHMVMSIVDIHGKQVLRLEDEVQGHYVKQVNLQGVAKGLYYVQVNMDNFQRTQKLVIE